MTEKVSKIIVRGQDGNLLHILPRTAASAVAYAEGTVDSELQRQDGKDVSTAETAINSVTSTQNVVEEINKSINITNNYVYIEFMLGYQYERDGSTVYDATYASLTDDNYYNTNVISSNIAESLNSNTIYNIIFSLPNNLQNIEFNGLQFSIGYLDPDNSASYNQLLLAPNNIDTNNYSGLNTSSSYIVTNSSYTLWDHPVDLAKPIIEIEFPTAVNETKRWNSNLIWKDDYDEASGSSTITYTENSANEFIEISLTKTGENEYNLAFNLRMQTSHEIETTVKSLQTSIELNDGTEISSETPISGLLQNVSIERKTDWVEISSSNTGPQKSYRTCIIVNDADTNS